MKKEIIKQLKLLAIFEAMIGKKWPARTYEDAAESIIRTVDDDFYILLKESRVTQVPLVGEVVARKIYEIRDHGKIQKIKYYEKEFPIDVEDLIKVDGIGPRTLYALFTTLGIKTKKHLLESAKRGELIFIKGITEDKQQKILNQLS